jgi:HlyD family secretion protein
MMKKILIGIGLLVVLSGVTLALVGRPHAAVSNYRLVTVQRGALESLVSATGNLQAVKTVEVGTQVSGQIAEILVDFNSRVQAGQLIARIDPTLLQQQVLASEANLERSQADLDDAKREADRQQTLFGQGLAATTDLQTAQYKYNIAQAAMKLSKVNLDLAKRNLAYSEIRSPIDGVVIARNVDVGQTVAASLSAPTLFVIAEDLTKMQILASVDESDIGRVHQGQQVRFSVQSYPNATFSGKVSQVRLQSAVTENVVSYTAVIDIGNSDGRLLPGMTATVQFVVDSVENALKVPNAALRFTPAGVSTTSGAGAQTAASPTAAVTTQASAAVQTGATTQTGATAQAGPSSQAGSARQAGAGSGGSGGSTRRRSASAGTRGTLWYLDARGNLASLQVEKGITDGQTTQISGEGVKEGLQVIASAAGSTAAATSTSSSPFQSQQQGSRPPGPGPGM